MRPAVVALVAWMGLVATPATSTAARPVRRLTGEKFSATVDDTSYFVPGACYSGGPASSSFSFTGTATGPYPGTYRETGTIAYRLNPALSDELIAAGPVTAYSATFTVRSAAGTVTGTERLDRAGAADQDADCYESAGGTSFETSALTPAYAATIRTGSGTVWDHGSSAATLSSFLALGGSVAGSGEDEALTSTAPACQRSRPATPRSRRHRPRRSRRHARGGRRREGARLTASPSSYWCSASHSA